MTNSWSQLYGWPIKFSFDVDIRQNKELRMISYIVSSPKFSLEKCDSDRLTLPTSYIWLQLQESCPTVNWINKREILQQKTTANNKKFNWVETLATRSFQQFLHQFTHWSSDLPVCPSEWWRTRMEGRNTWCFLPVRASVLPTARREERSLWRETDVASTTSSTATRAWIRNGNWWASVETGGVYYVCFAADP